MAAELLSEHHGYTLILTLCDPDNRNALGPDLYAAGLQAVVLAAQDDTVRSLIITGAGPWFCAGGNLRRLQANRERPESVQGASIQSLNQWIQALRQCGKPVIAAVEGAAAGAGFSLALACDLIVAAQDAQFVMAYSNIALSPDGGASWHLGRALPRQRAAEILMLGERLSAEALHRLGLVNRLSAPGESLAVAKVLAEQLNQRAPNALASIKELLGAATSQPLEDQMAQECDHFVRNLHHDNGGAGIQAFLTKTTAKYL